MPDQVKKENVIAVEKTKEARVEELIRQLREGSKNKRIKAAELLGKLGNEIAVEPLIKALEDGNTVVLHFVKEALEKLGNKKAGGLLIKALGDEDPSVRCYAAEVLGNLRNKKAVGPLIKALGDEDPSVRRYAAKALGDLGSEIAVKPLIKLLDDKESWVRSNSAEALGKLGSEKSVEPLIKALKDNDANVCRKAAEALGKLGGEKSVSALIELLSAEETSNRSAAAKALGEIGGEKSKAALMRASGAEKGIVSYEIAIALGKAGSKKAEELLIKALGDRFISIRRDAAEALGRLGREKSVEPLIKALGDEDSSVCSSAARALGKLGSEIAVEPLIKALGDEDPSVRYSAAEALVKTGKKHPEDPLLKVMLDNEDLFIRETNIGSAGVLIRALDVLWDQSRVDREKVLLIEQTIKRVDEKALIKWKQARFKQKVWPDFKQKLAWILKITGIIALLSILLSLVSKIRALRKYGQSVKTLLPVLFILSLFAFGSPIMAQDKETPDQVKKENIIAAEKIKEARVEELIRQLREGSAYDRARAAGALEKLGGCEAVKPLIKALGDKDSSVRCYAAELLGNMGSEKAVEPLIKALGDEDPSVRRYAAGALGKLGSRKAVKPLIKALGDKDSSVRCYAAEFLGNMGSEIAVEPLIKALGDEDPSVRFSAAEALVKIGKKHPEDPLFKVMLDDEDFFVYETGNGSAGGLIRALDVLWDQSPVDREKVLLIEQTIKRVDEKALMEWKQNRFKQKVWPGFKQKLYGILKITGIIALLSILLSLVSKIHALRKYGQSVKTLLPVLFILSLFAFGSPIMAQDKETPEQVKKEKVTGVEKKNKPRVEQLIMLLREGNENERSAAAEALGKLGNKRAVEPLIGLLGDKQRQVREKAAKALGNLGSEESVAPLLTAMGDKCLMVSYHAEKALVKLGSEIAVESLIKSLGDKKFQRSCFAAELLGELGKERAVEPLIKALKDKKITVRNYAARALGKLGGKKAVAALIKLLFAEEGPNCREAAAALSKLKKSPENINVILQRFSDADVWMKVVFADVLVILCGREAVKPLIEALRDKHKSVRVKAAETLGELGSEKAVAPLIYAALGDNDYMVRRGAAEALFEIWDKCPESSLACIACLGRYEFVKKAENGEKDGLTAVFVNALTNLWLRSPVDREKVLLLERAIGIMDKSALIKWKQDRFKQKVWPDFKKKIRPFLKAAGLLALCLLVSSVLLKLKEIFRLRNEIADAEQELSPEKIPGIHAEGMSTRIKSFLRKARDIIKSHKLLVLLIITAVICVCVIYTGNSDMPEYCLASGAFLGQIDVRRGEDKQNAEAVMARNMVKMHDLMRRSVKEKKLTADLNEPYEFTRRDRRKWSEFINMYRDEMGLTKAFIRGAWYVYGDMMRSSKDEQVFIDNLKELDLEAVKSFDSREVNIDELVSVGEITHVTEVFESNPSVLYSFYVRQEKNDGEGGAIQRVAEMLGSEKIEDQKKGILTWQALPDEAAETLVDQGLQFDDGALVRAVVYVAGKKRFTGFSGRLLRFTKNGDPELAAASLEALAEMGYKKAAAEIYNDLISVKEQDIRVFKARIRAIALLGYKGAEDNLIDTVIRHLEGGRDDDEVKGLILDALVSLGSRKKTARRLKELQNKTGIQACKKAIQKDIIWLEKSTGIKAWPVPYQGDRPLEELCIEIRGLKNSIDKGFREAVKENMNASKDYYYDSDYFYRNGTKLQFIDTKMPINNRAESKESVPDKSTTRIIPVLKAVKDLQKIAQAVMMRDPLLLVGDTGVGKTTLIRYLARLSKNNLYRFNLNGQTDKTEFIGGYKPGRRAFTVRDAYKFMERVTLEEPGKNREKIIAAVSKVSGSEVSYGKAVEVIKGALEKRATRMVMDIAEAVNDSGLEFEWHYGVLLEAMRRGHWIVMDEINLAEPEVIERIRYLLDAHPRLELSEHNNETWIGHQDYDSMVEDYIRKNLGPGKERDILVKEAVKELTAKGFHRIHQNFRLFATMNPAEYEGRNKLSAAFLNKFRLKWIHGLSPDEIRGILKKKYEFDGETIDKIMTIHEKLTEISGSGGRLGRNEGISYYFTIRHLFRLADRVERAHNEASAFNREKPRSEKDRMIWREAVEVYRDGLRSKDDRDLFDEVLGYKFIWETPDIGEDMNGAIGRVDLPVNTYKEFVPGEDSKLKQVKSTAIWLEKIARCIQMNEKPLLIGPTGAAKTSLIRFLARRTNSEFIRVNLDAHTDTSDLVGREAPVGGSDGKFKWEDGILIKAMEKGQWLLLDEFNLAEPDILERLNSLLDDDGSFVVTENNNEKWVSARIYKRLKQAGEDMSRIRCINPNFRIFAAMNPSGYTGRNKLSRAMLNKFTEKWIPVIRDSDEVKDIVRFYLEDEAVIKEAPIKDSYLINKLAEIFTGVYLKLTDMIDKKEIGGGKISGASGTEYNFSLRDLKDWAKFVRRLHPSMGVNTALIEGALFVFRDRLEDSQDKELFRDKILKVAGQADSGHKQVDIDKLDILEEEGRRPEELITDAVFSDEEMKRVSSEEVRQILMEKFDALTTGFPPALKDGLSEIRRRLNTPGQADEGVRGFALLPEDTARLLIEPVFDSLDAGVLTAACEVTAHFGFYDFNERIRELLRNNDEALRITAALALEKLGTKFPPNIFGRPEKLKYWDILRKITGKASGSGIEEELDFCGTFLKLVSGLFSVSLLPLALSSFCVPLGFLPFMGGVILILGVMLAGSYAALKLFQGIIYKRQYSFVNRRYEGIPLNPDDFYKLFGEFRGEKYINFGIMGEAPENIQKKVAAVIISILGGIILGILCGIAARSLYECGVLMARHNGMGASSIWAFIVYSAVFGLVFGCGLTNLFLVWVSVLSNLILYPLFYKILPVEKLIGMRRLKVNLKGYARETIDLFKKYKEEQGRAAFLSEGISSERTGIQDIEAVIRKNKVIEITGRDGRKKLMVDNIELPVMEGTGTDNLHVPDKEDAALVNTISTVRNMKKAAISLLMDEPALLVGESGAGKTSVIRYLASRLNWGFRRFNLNGQTEKAELIGGYRPDKRGNFKWVDGIVVEAMRAGDILVLDEINLAESQVLERLNSLLDDDRQLNIQENNTLWISSEKFDARVREVMSGENISEPEAVKRLEAKGDLQDKQKFQDTGYNEPH
ncbi:MAG: HEAT repeat domain-containing protein [Candidatus Omnitrophota bacterium]